MKKYLLLLLLILLSGCAPIDLLETNTYKNNQNIDLKDQKIPDSTPDTQVKVSPENIFVSEFNKVLQDIADIIGLSEQTPSPQEFEWDSFANQATIQGRGYKVTEKISETKVESDIEKLKNYLEQNGFKANDYNAINPDPNFEQIRVSKNNIACIINKINDQSTQTKELQCACGLLASDDEATTNETKMTEKEAIQIAESSQCLKDGTLNKEDTFYNENSQTWWITMISDKEGCNPACVVSSDKTAEVNWRCTGLLNQ